MVKFQLLVFLRLSNLNHMVLSEMFLRICIGITGILPIFSIFHAFLKIQSILRILRNLCVLTLLLSLRKIGFENRNEIFLFIISDNHID